MSLGIVEAAYERLIAFMLESDPFWDRLNTGPTLGPITEAEHIRRENYEKGRLLHEQANALGYYGDCDHY